MMPQYTNQIRITHQKSSYDLAFLLLTKIYEMIFEKRVKMQKIVCEYPTKQKKDLIEIYDNISSRLQKLVEKSAVQEIISQTKGTKDNITQLIKGPSPFYTKSNPQGEEIVKNVIKNQTTEVSQQSMNYINALNELLKEYQCQNGSTTLIDKIKSIKQKKTAFQNIIDQICIYESSEISQLKIPVSFQKQMSQHEQSKKILFKIANVIKQFKKTDDQLKPFRQYARFFQIDNVLPLSERLAKPLERLLVQYYELKQKKQDYDLLIKQHRWVQWTMDSLIQYNFHAVENGIIHIPQNMQVYIRGIKNELENGLKASFKILSTLQSILQPFTLNPDSKATCFKNNSSMSSVLSYANDNKINDLRILAANIISFVGNLNFFLQNPKKKLSNSKIEVPGELDTYLDLIKTLLNQKQQFDLSDGPKLQHNWNEICEQILPQKEKLNSFFNTAKGKYEYYKDKKKILIKQWNNLKKQLGQKQNKIQQYEKRMSDMGFLRYLPQIELSLQLKAMQKNSQLYKDIIREKQQSVKNLKIQVSKSKSETDYFKNSAEDLKKSIKSKEQADKQLNEEMSSLKLKNGSLAYQLNKQRQQNISLNNLYSQLIKKQMQLENLFKKEQERYQTIMKQQLMKIHQKLQSKHKFQSGWGQEQPESKQTEHLQIEETILKDGSSNEHISHSNHHEWLNQPSISSQILHQQLNGKEQLLQTKMQTKIDLLKIIQDLQRTKSELANAHEGCAHTISEQQVSIGRIKAQTDSHCARIEQLILNNKASEIDASYSYNSLSGDNSGAYLTELTVALEAIITNFKTERSRILFEKAEEHSLKHQLQKEATQLKEAQQSLSLKLSQTEHSLNEMRERERTLLQNIQSLKQEIQSLKNANALLSDEIKRCQQSMKSKTQEIARISQEKELQNLQLQSLHSSFIEVQNAELERERQYKINSLFDGQSCLDNLKESFPIKQSLIDQIEKINGKTVNETCLLYKYSPQAKLQWTHFVNKPHFVMLIRTEKEKIIAVYSQSPIMKPPLSQDKREDIAFIFESNIKGGDTDFYPLLSGKSINGSFGNSVAFGKSDLRFVISDTMIEGNFGYAGTSFETKGEKITDLLGSSKIRMTAYEIYSVELSEQVEVKALESRKQGRVNLPQVDRKVEIEFSKGNHYEQQLKTLRMDFERQKTELNKTIAELQQTIATQRDQISVKKQECDQLKVDIRSSLSKAQEVQQRLKQSQKRYAEVQSNLKQVCERHANLQKETTHLTEMYNTAVSQIERLKVIEVQLNSRIADLSVRQSNGEEEAASIKAHEQQKIKLKASVSRLQKELTETKKQRQQLSIQLKESAKTHTQLQTQISRLEQKISELDMKIEQYEYNQQGGHAKEVLLMEEDEPSEQLFAKEAEIIKLTHELSRLTAVNDEMVQTNAESSAKMEQLEREKTALSRKLLQLQSDNSSLITKITEQSLQTERLRFENDQLLKTNKQLHQKLTAAEAVSLKEQVNRQMEVSATTSKLPPSAAIQLQHYNTLAETYGLDPFLIAQYDKSFQAQVLCNQLQHKITLIRHLQLRMKQSFSCARLVYRYDPFNATLFHKYVDSLDSLLCVVKTIHGVYLAGYYSGSYVQNQILNRPGCLISITNNESYDLHNEKTHPSQRAFRGMIFNEFFIIFGNAEIRIRANEKTVFSNFGIAASFFNPRNKKVHDLLGEGESRQVEFESYELYQVAFDKQIK